MGRAAWQQANFTAGEITPLLSAAGDNNLKFYKNGLARCLNAIPLVQGSTTRRPGTKFAGDTISPSVKSRLIPFKFSVTQAYAIEFGDQKISWFLNHGQLTETGLNITAATQANPCVITINAHGYSNGDRVYISGVGGMTRLNGRTFTVAGVTANTFQLSGIDSSAYAAYTAGGTAARIYTIASPYLEADLPRLKYVQSQDVLYLFHPSYAPRKLARTAATTWTLSVINFLDGPYGSENTTATTLTPSAFAVGAGVTLTASSTTGINGGTGFQTTDVGRLIRIKEGAVWGWVKITGWTSTTVVTVEIFSTLTSTAAKTVWRLGTWSGTTGYPACATFYEDRLVIGGEPAQRLDLSVSGDYENFAPSSTAGVVSDSSAIAITLNADDVNRIRWAANTERGLVIGTYGDEWVLRPSNQNEALTPTNVKAIATTKHGSADFMPVRADGAVLFINRSRRALHEYAYNFESDAFRAPDMTVIAEHIVGAGISFIEYQREPDNIIWTLRDDGSLIGFTYSREQQVTGWHEHILGGVSDAGGSQAIVESICVIPEPNGAYDELWLTVKRYKNGAVFRSVEYLTERWRDGQAQEDAFFLDCGLTYDGASTLTITGLDHLEGLSVAILTDGAAHPNKTVASGGITLDRASEVVQIGLHRDMRVQLLPVELGSQNGANLGKIKRINHASFNVWQSLGGKQGPNDALLSPLSTRQGSDPMNSAPPLQSGWIHKRFEGGHEDAPTILVVQDQPFPMTIRAIAADVETSDR